MDMARTPPPHTRKGEVSQNTGMDSGMYCKLSNPLAQDDPRRMTEEGIEIKLETLTDMLPLLQATQNPPLDFGTRSLIYDIGPWKGENLLAGIETFFQKNAYHPFATCGNSECGKTGPIPMSTTTYNTTSEQLLPTRSIEHFCECETCFTTDPTNFRSTRHHTRDRTFLDKTGIFDFRTIASGETIREPVTT